jgi:anti-anti-sigma factor
MTVTEQSESGVEVLVLEGEADLAAAPAIQARLKAKRAAGAAALVLDFTGTTFVNTPVWALVVEHFQHARETGTGFALAGLGGRVLASFELVRLGDFIDHFPSVPEAVAAVAAKSPGGAP